MHYIEVCTTTILAKEGPREEDWVGLLCLPNTHTLVENDHDANKPTISELGSPLLAGSL
jgi:hypothetical protein